MEYNTIIVGAGPAGLAVAGALRHREIPFIMLEKSHRVADSWERFYDRLCLHTIKKFSSLPHRPLPDQYPKYVPKKQLLDYFKSYASEFNINPVYNEEVIHIEKHGRLWRVNTHSNQYNASHVVVCTGVNRFPNKPEWPGIESFEGTIVHSIDYKNAKPYIGKKVLVIGMGNSGAEIALDLCENGVYTFISVRGPVNIVPREFLGNPTQATAKLLAKLPYWLGDGIGATVRQMAFGNLSRYGLKTPALAPARQLRKLGHTPVIDIGTIQQVKKGRIKIKPAIHSIDGEEIQFVDDSWESFDAIIMATGFVPKIDDLFKNTAGLVDDKKVPREVICKGEHKGLFFVGFNPYSLGILDTIHKESLAVATVIARDNTEKV